MNPVGMGDWSSVNRDNRGGPGEAVVSMVPEEAPKAAAPMADLPEAVMPEPVKARGLDLTNPVAARSEGLDAAMAASLIPDAVVSGFPSPAPMPAPTPVRFNPRDWITLPGYMISANKRLDMEPLAAPEVAVVARRPTIGNILKDGLGRGVRSGNGSIIRTRSFD